MRYPASDKAEIIRLVEQSHLPVRRTLEKLGIPRATFYRWYDLYQAGGPEALEGHCHVNAVYAGRGFSDDAPVANPLICHTWASGRLASRTSIRLNVTMPPISKGGRLSGPMPY